MQTSTALSMKMAKQYSQACNNLSNCFLCHFPYILKFAWKYIHPIFHNIASRHTDSPCVRTVEQSNHAWSSLANCCVVSCPTYLKIEWKSVWFFSRNILPNTDPGITKIDPWSKGYINIAFQKCFSSRQSATCWLKVLTLYHGKKLATSNF